MRKDDMRVAPLAVLQQHRSQYDHHRRKLESIIRNKPHPQEGESFERLEMVRQNLQKFEHRQYTRSLELARQNEMIVKKLESIKAIISFKNSQHVNKTSPLSRSPSFKQKSFTRDVNMDRLKDRVKSMGSELSRKGMLRDYDRSLQIKNRIMRYQTEHNNRVSLKADKVLSVNHHRSALISARLHHSKPKQQPLPEVKKNNNRESLLPKVGQRLGKIRKIQPLPKGMGHHRKEQIKSKLRLQQKLARISQESDYKTENISRQPTTFCTAVDQK